jgi:hypothetical protein
MAICPDRVKSSLSGAASPCALFARFFCWSAIVRAVGLRASGGLSNLPKIHLPMLHLSMNS